MSRWKQPYLVITFCRLLFTLSEGRLPSKREAAGWALGALDRRRLRRRVRDALRDGEQQCQPADTRSQVPSSSPAHAEPCALSRREVARHAVLGNGDEASK
jgi:Domain of unknown function (DUF4111)